MGRTLIVLASAFLLMLGTACSTTPQREEQEAPDTVEAAPPETELDSAPVTVPDSAPAAREKLPYFDGLTITVQERVVIDENGKPVVIDGHPKVERIRTFEAWFDGHDQPYKPGDRIEGTSFRVKAIRLSETDHKSWLELEPIDE